MGQRSKNEDGKDILPSAQIALIDFIAGSLGGVGTVLVGQPFDTVKVKMQTHPSTYKSMLQTTSVTINQNGFFRGLYAGTLPSIAANVGELSMLFMCYGQCQDVVAKVKNQKVADLSPLENAFAGSLAGIFASLVLCPIEHIKCQLQTLSETPITKEAKERGTVGRGKKLTISELVRSQGFVALYRGLIPTLAREIPGCFFFFLGNEGSKRAITRFTGRERAQMTPLDTMLCGGMAGVAFWATIFPFDSIKSRVQIEGASKTTKQIVAEVWTFKGFGGFYSGLFPCVLRAFPSTAAMFLAYEYSRASMLCFATGLQSK